jgi:hypothetical protein
LVTRQTPFLIPLYLFLSFSAVILVLAIVTVLLILAICIFITRDVRGTVC